MRMIKEDRTTIPKRVSDLAKKINRILGVDANGLVIYLATNDYRGYPDRTYHEIAFHMNIERGGIHETSPDDVLLITKYPNTRNLVWLSKDAWQGSAICFAWIYSHELKHLLQDLEHPEIDNLTKQLKAKYSECGTNKIPVYSLPIEVDADLAAKYVIEKIFSEQEIEEFFNAKIESSPRSESFRRIKDEEATLDYNYKQKTLEQIDKLVKE